MGVHGGALKLADLRRRPEWMSQADEIAAELVCLEVMSPIYDLGLLNGSLSAVDTRSVCELVLFSRMDQAVRSVVHCR